MTSIISKPVFKYIRDYIKSIIFMHIIVILFMYQKVSSHVSWNNKTVAAYSDKENDKICKIINQHILYVQIVGINKRFVLESSIKLIRENKHWQSNYQDLKIITISGTYGEITALASISSARIMRLVLSVIQPEFSLIGVNRETKYYLFLSFKWVELYCRNYFQEEIRYKFSMRIFLTTYILNSEFNMMLR